MTRYRRILRGGAWKDLAPHKKKNIEYFSKFIIYLKMCFPTYTNATSKPYQCQSTRLHVNDVFLQCAQLRHVYV